MVQTYFDHLWGLVLEASPWLLLGLLAAGLIKATISTQSMARWLGGPGYGPIFRAAIIGTPLPLCSCSVLPAAIGLNRQGASRGATVSFLIATPENGADSIALSYALLGPFMTIARPIAAAISAIVTGVLARSITTTTASHAAYEQKESCCENACDNHTDSAARPPLLRRLIDSARYAMTDILDDIALWTIAGLAIAAAVATVVPPDALSQWGSGLPAMLAMLGVGIPMYICASASTPIAAAMLLAGVSPGTVLVFLLAGPATNFASIAVIRKELGTPTLWVYLLGICISSIVLGLLTDFVVSYAGIDIAAQASAGHELIPMWLSATSAAVLTFFAIRPLRRAVFPTSRDR